MSCAENDSGPFVVFFLPALVGGLTILLARRWTNVPASGASTTAVSRRRRIIKDPLIRRPQTLVSAKMISPTVTGKKTLPLQKKAACVLGGEVGGEDGAMAPGGRRVQRATRVSPAPPAAPIADTVHYSNPPAPKHIPFPVIATDGELLFETMTFIFTSLAAGLQFLNLYRTVWWLPHSHTSQAMNFYLMDPHVVAFIIIMQGRRLLLCSCTELLRGLAPPKLLPHAMSALRMFILGVVLGALAWCAYFILLKYSFTNIFYLMYPATIYIILFGAQASPFLELGTGSSHGSRPPLHCCTASPAAARAEVDVLKADFNGRMKRVMFGSVTSAYYTCFIPLCFAQSFLYYDMYNTTQHLALVWLSLLTSYTVQYFPANYCDVLHRSALHLGSWVKGNEAEVQAQDDTVAGASVGAGVGAGVVPWCGRTLWSRGARVCAAGGVYTAAAIVNAAQPGLPAHQRFYAVFRHPPLFLCSILCLQMSLILLQLCLLFTSAHWHHFLSLSVLLFCNYYTVFKLVRDYLVSWKVYKAEYMIQYKSNPRIS